MRPGELNDRTGGLVKSRFALAGVITVLPFKPRLDRRMQVTAWAGLALMSRAVREERGKYIPPAKF